MPESHPMNGQPNKSCPSQRVDGLPQLHLCSSYNLNNCRHFPFWKNQAIRCEKTQVVHRQKPMHRFERISSTDRPKR